MSYKHLRPENENRSLYRKACLRHVVTFELIMSEDNKRHLFRLNDRVRQAGNSIAGLLSRRMEQMKRTKKYRLLQKDYSWNAEHLKKLKEGTDDYDICKKKLSLIGKKMNAIQKEYGVTWSDARIASVETKKQYNIPSVFATTRAEDIWSGVQKVLYRDGKTIHFHKRGCLPVLRAKEIERIIRLVYDKKTNSAVILMDGFSPMNLLVPKDDYYDARVK